MNSILNSFSLNECSKILKQKLKSENYIVDSYEFCALNEKVGFLADHYYLKVIYSVNQKREIAKFFVKCMISSEAEKKFVLETGAFYKECCMFQELVPKFIQNHADVIKDCIPMCYLISDEDFLIFEDLTAMGYITVDHRRSLSVKYVRKALETLAKFHCSSLIFEEEMARKIGETYIIPESCPKMFQEMFYTSSLKSSIDVLEAIKKGAITLIELLSSVSDVDRLIFKQLSYEIFDQFPEIVKPSTIFRNTICHSDLWPSNIMFKLENEKLLDCRLIDFQSYRYAPPAQDLLAFLYLSTNRMFRKEHMGDMINYYYDQTSKILTKHDLHVDKILPLDEFRESCDYYKTFAIAQTMHHFPLIMMPKEEIKSLFSNQENVQKFFFDDRREVIFEMCNKYNEYANRLQETIEDLEDIFKEKGLL